MSTTLVAPEVKRGRNRLAAIVVLGHGIKHIYNSGLQQILLPEIKIGLALNRTQFGSLVSSRQAMSWVTTIGAGYLGDRFSNKASLMLGLSLGMFGVSLLLMGYAPNYWTMLVIMLLVGVGPSLYHPPAIGALARRFPDRRGFAISLHGTGGIAGEVLGPLAAAGALTFLMWRDVLKTSMFPALLAAFVIWAMMRSLPGKEEAQVSSLRDYLFSLARLLKNHILLVLVIATALTSMGESAVDGFLPVYLREDLAFSPTRVAVYLSLAKIAGLASQPAMGFLSDSFGRKAVLVPGAAAIGLLSLALSVADPGAQLVTIMVAKGAFTFTLHHIYIAAAIDAAGGHVQSTVVSLIYGAGFLGAISPYFAGLISDEFGIHSAFLFGGSIALLATVALLTLDLPSADLQAKAASGGQRRERSSRRR